MKLPLQHFEVSIAASLYSVLSFILVWKYADFVQTCCFFFFIFFFLHVPVVPSEFAHEYGAAFFKSHIDSMDAAKQAARLHVDNKTEFTPFFKTT